MKRLCLILSVAGLAGCGSTPDSALSVRIRVAPSLKADCIELAVSSGGAQRKSLMLARTAMKDEWVIGVKRGDDLPETVTFQARAYLGTCGDASSLKLNSRSSEVQATFPKEGSEEVQPLQLDPPDASLDGDRDGFTAVAAGGGDCDDTNPTTFPGSVQLCTTEEDTDCDGLGACADSDCSGSAVCVDPPDRLALVGVPLQVERTRCGGPFKVELRNAAGPRAAGVTTTVQLTATLAGFGFFTEPSCTTPVTSVAVAFQQAQSTDVYVRGDTAGPVELRAASGALTPATSDLVVTPVPATQLVFSSPARTIVAGVCNANEMTVELRDAQGRPTTVSAPLTVSLTASPNDTGGNFSLAADCTAPVSTVSILAGQGTATFRVFSRRATAAGMPMQVEARTDVGLPMSLVAAQGVTVTADLPAKLAFLNQPLAIKTTDLCSAGRLDVEVQDQYGNRSPTTQALTLTFSGSSGVSFFDDAAGACTTPVMQLPLAVGGTGVRLAVRSGIPGTGSVSVSEQSAILVGDTQALTVSTGDPTKVVFEPNPRTTDSNICTSVPVTLVARDAADVRSSFTTPRAIRLTTVPVVPGLSFYTAAGCGMGSRVTGDATFPAGVSQIQLYFQGPTAQDPFTIQATPQGGGVAGSDLPGNAIRPGPPASLRFSPTAATTSAGACAGPVTVSIFDGVANPTAFTLPTDLTLATTGGPLTWGTTAGSCAGTSPVSIPAGQTSVQVYLTSNVSRATAYAVSAAAGTASTSGTFALTVTPGASTGLSMVEPMGGAATLVAGTCVQVTVERKDSLGNDVPVGGSGAMLTFTGVPTGVTLYGTQNGCQTATGAVGSFSLAATESRKTFYVRGQTTLSAAAFTATLLGQSATLTLTVTPAAASVLVFNGLPTSKTAGVCSGPLSLTRKDAFGNDATADGALQANLTGAGLSYFPNGDCTIPSAGSGTVDFPANQATSSVFSVSGVTVGTYPITATAGALVLTRNFDVTVGMASKVVIITTPTAPVDAGSCVQAQAGIYDANNNPVSGTVAVALSSAPDAVSFYGAMGCSSPPVTSVNTAGSIATFWFKPTLPQAALVITAGSAGLTSGTQTWQVQLGPPAKLAWKATFAPPALLARFTCAGPFTVELQDAANNVLTAAADRTVTLTAPGGTAGLTFFSDPTCATTAASTVMMAGTSEASFYLVGTGGMTMASTVTAASTGVTSATQAVGVNGPQGTLTATATLAYIEAGACLPITVTRRDGASAPVTLGTTTFSLVSANTAISLHAMSNCTDSGVASLARTIGPGASTVVGYARGRSIATATPFTLTPNEANAGSTAVAVSLTAQPLVRRGTCPINTMQPSSTCPVALPSTDISRTFLVFQATGSQNTPDDANVECHLVATTQVDVVCSRQNNPNSAINVNWQTVSWGRSALEGGLTVHQLLSTPATTVNSVDLTLPADVDMSRSFVLMSSKSSGGVSANDNDAEDFVTARLTAPNTVRLEGTDNFPTATYSVQVVELAGARVDRNVSNVAANTFSTTFVTSLVSPVTTRISPLFSARTANGATPAAMCKRRFRGNLNGSPFGVFVDRGGNLSSNGVCNESASDVAWELIEWPAGTSVARPAMTLQMNATVPTATWTNAGLVDHRTLLYLAGQGPGGQSAGEGELTDDVLGDISARLEFSGSNVLLTRGSTTALARFMPWGVQFDP